MVYIGFSVRSHGLDVGCSPLIRFIFLCSVHSASSLVWGCRAWVGAKTSLGWSPQRETPQNCSQDLSGMWNGLKEAGLKQAGLGEARLGEANLEKAGLEEADLSGIWNGLGPLSTH